MLLKVTTSLNITWSFTLVLENQEAVLPLNPDGCRSDVNDNEHRYPLGERAPWEITNPLRIRVDAPDRPNIIPEDGWDLTFRLFNEDNASYTIYNESTFTFQLDVFADPSVAEVWISSGSMEESTDATVSIGFAMMEQLKRCFSPQILHAQPQQFIHNKSQ